MAGGLGCAWQMGGMHDRGSCVARGGHAWREEVGCACVAGQTATAVEGTHPTGMHSC